MRSACVTKPSQKPSDTHRQQVGLHDRIFPAPQGNGRVPYLVLVHRSVEPVHLQHESPPRRGFGGGGGGGKHKLPSKAMSHRKHPSSAVLLCCEWLETKSARRSTQQVHVPSPPSLCFAMSERATHDYDIYRTTAQLHRFTGT